MDSSPPASFGAISAAYIGQAFEEMMTVARDVGDRLNDKPLGPTTNSVGALIFHCAEVCEFWLGHVALGRPSTRQREAEFDTVVELADLERKVAATVEQVSLDLAALDAGKGTPSEIRQFVLCDGTDESIAAHMIEELYQHLGHIELTADVFRFIS